nr:hypothetical protein [Acinetobacter baumannii]
MAINDDLYWYKNVLKRTISTTIRFYLSISIILSPIILINEANATDDGDWWLQREIKLQQNRDDYARRVYGRSARSFLETDPVTAKTKLLLKSPLLNLHQRLLKLVLQCLSVWLSMQKIQACKWLVY